MPSPLEQLPREPGSEGTVLLPDGRACTLYPTVFGGRFLIGPKDDHIGGDEEFMFDDLGTARLSFETWNGYGQPAGWIRWKVKDVTYRKGPDGKPVRSDDS